jgi:hypothetical protein
MGNDRTIANGYPKDSIMNFDIYDEKWEDKRRIRKLKLCRK